MREIDKSTPDLSDLLCTGKLVVLVICGYKRLGYIIKVLENGSLRLLMLDTVIKTTTTNRSYATFPLERVVKIANIVDIVEIISNLRGELCS